MIRHNSSWLDVGSNTVLGGFSSVLRLLDELEQLYQEHEIVSVRNNGLKEEDQEAGQWGASAEDDCLVVLDGARTARSHDIS